MKKKPTRPPQTKTLTPEQFRREYLREYFRQMGRSAFYQALNRKEIPAVRIGRRLSSREVQMKKKPTTRPQTKTLTPEQARREYFPQMGRSAFYQALNRKEIPAVRIGRRFVIPRTAAESFLDTCGRSGQTDQ